MVLERVNTGISGLDEMLMGGIPKNKHVALCGGPGCGKTSFGFEFVYRGAEMGEAGLYLTMEETPEDIVTNMKATFPELSKIDALVKAKKIIIAKPDKLDLEQVAEEIEEGIEKHEVKRVIIDSATMIRMSFKGELDYRQTLFEFFSLLRNLDCTVMMTIEATSPRREQVVFDIEHFVMDGIINIYNLDQGDRRIRSLEIFKMRGTDHSRELVPFKVTPSGIKIYVGEKVF
jgi:circadian clock protein KaiC